MLLTGVCFLAITGCWSKSDRPELAPVQGKVTLDGDPLVGASIVFHPQQGKVSRAKTDAEGRYELVYLRDIMGAKLGEHRVAITTWTEETRQERLPLRYHSRSELSAVVKDEPNEFNFTLESE